MPVHQLKCLRFNLIICLALSVLLFGLTTSALAGVINFKKLLPFVDVKIPGWTMEGQPSGATITQGPMSVSEAKAEFKAGDKTLEVSVTDLFGKPVPMMMGQKMEMETNEEIVRTTAVQGFKAIQHYNKKDKDGSLIISVADRFLMKIEGKGIDNLKVLQDVAQRLDLKKLAALAK
jgi:hypothetical protein